MNNEENNTTPIEEAKQVASVELQPSSTLSNMFKTTPVKVAKKEEPVIAQTSVSCTNCEDSGKTCSVCGFDRG